MQEYIDMFVRYKLSNKKSMDRTIKKYVYCINEFIEMMDIKTIEDIDNLTWVDINTDYINIKKEELSAQSINLRITSLKGFFNFLEGKRLIKENVAAKLTKEKCESREVKVDMDKIKLMLKLVNEDYENNKSFINARNRYLVHLFLFVGGRNEEVRNLKLDSINIKGEFSLTGKFNKTREVCLPNKMLKMHFDYLMNYRNLVEDNSDYLFVSSNGNMLDHNVPLNLIKKYAQLSGMGDNFHCHDMRHLCITTLIESGVDIAEVSKIVGHSSINTTQKNYFKPSTKKVQENINKNDLLNEII